MKMKKFVYVITLLLCSSHLFGYNSLTVGDPRASWYTYQGTIEEATLAVRPKGIFIEYGLYLTFSSRGTVWNNVNDTVEVVLQFDLPENAIIRDSWLWIGNDIIKAKILDKWTASLIYEGIVKRRRDPSILTKTSSTHYELRVFPMAGNQTRKVKITYLVPASWNKNTVSASLPLPILNTSKYPVSNFPIFLWVDDALKLPTIVNEPSIQFTDETDPSFGLYKKATIPSSKYNSDLEIAFPSPLKDGLFLSKYQYGDEGFYQLVIIPSVTITDNENRKVAMLIDFDASNSLMNAHTVLNTVKAEMLKNLNPLDSFNLIVSGLTITRYSDKWKPATAVNIEAAFTQLYDRLATYSNLASLLSDGINFIKANGNDGKIVLIANSDQFGDYQVANTLINDLLAMMKPKIPIHIADYQSTSIPYYYNGGIYYQGNEYFNSNLAKLTTATVQRVIDGKSEAEVISNCFKSLKGSINAFDLHTTLKNGYCHSRFMLYTMQNMIFYDSPIYQVGKFSGSFPLQIEMSGNLNNKVISSKFEVPEIDTYLSDSVLRSSWAGMYIKKLETDAQTNDVISEIINQSITERVLSKYTSFLCIEDTNDICYGCKDETILVNLPNSLKNNDSIVAYPNPFKDKLTIEVKTMNKQENCSLAIYDLRGVLLYTFDVSNFESGKNNILNWNGRDATGNELKPGIYALIYKTSLSAKTIKLIKK